MDISKLPLISKTGPADASRLQGKTVVLYFSAHWCPPCRGFTPKLRQFYETLKSKGENIEIIFISGDRDEASFQEYFQNEHGDWLALKYGSPEIKEFNETFQVQGIPYITVVNNKGECVIPGDKARDDVGGNPEAAFAEWKKAAGDWRETAGTALGGTGAAPANDAAAMRAARLARLGGGGGGDPPAAAPAPAPAPADPATQPPNTMSDYPDPEVPAAPPGGGGGGGGGENIAKLQEMGFSEEQCRNALDATDGDFNQALELLIAST